MAGKKCFRLFSILLLSMLLALIGACGNANSTETVREEGAGGTSSEEMEGIITVSAAASLTDAMNDIARLFKEENPGVQVDYNFGGSGALRQQIMQGAPVDLFFSASASDFQAVVEEGYIDEENALNLLANELVLITSKGSKTVTSFDDLSNAKQIAIGNPESVPAGKYSVEAYKSMGIMEELEELLVFAEDVRAVLTYVETKSVDAGTVYRTDAMISEKVEIVDTAPAESHESIIYPVGVVNHSDNEDAVKAFYEYLQTDTARNVFEEYGFAVY